MPREVSTLGSREAAGESGETLLHVRSVDLSGAQIVVEVDAETETYVGRCPSVEVLVKSSGTVVGSRSLSTEGDFVTWPPTLDFYRCLGAARIRVQGVTAQDRVSFEVWTPDRSGEKIADGTPIRLSDLADMPEPPADDSIGGVVESNVQPLISAGIGVAGVYLLWDNIDTISDLFE